MRVRITSMLTLALLLVLASSAMAETRTWDGEAGNNWFTAANWDPDGGPVGSDQLIINSGTPSASSNVNIQGGSVTIAGGDVRWSGRFNSIGTSPSDGSLLITSGSLSVDYSAGESHSFNVGNGDVTGMLIQQGGTVNALNDNDEVKIGNGSSATGIYEISGGILNAGTIINGSGGTGTLHVIGDSATINTGGYTQNESSTLELDINGITPIDATGNVSLAGVLDVEFTVAPSAGQMFDIINYSGTLGGTFSSFDNVVDSPFGPDTVTLSIDYGSGSGDSVRLTVESAVPEPTTFGLLTAAMLVLGSVRTRRRPTAIV